MAMALIQWVIRSQSGWMTGRAGTAATMAESWVASIVIGPALARYAPITYCGHRPPSLDVAPPPATQLREEFGAGCSVGAGRPPARPKNGTTMSKTSAGNFFEDFRVGETIVHATPRTLTAGDVALYNGLY